MRFFGGVNQNQTYRYEIQGDYIWSPKKNAKGANGANGANGLLLTPAVDHLFDRGFIGFEPNGKLIISLVAHLQSLKRMGIETERTVNVGGFSTGQKQFLKFHRGAIFLESRR